MMTIPVRHAILAVLAAAAAAFGQPTVAPTNAPLGTSRGEDLGGYNVTNSFETGYRFRSVGGDLGKYRSDVNFGNGIRLLSGTVTVNSREGQGKYFDELLLSTQGLGNDPYQFASLRAGKNRVYRYDLSWRLNEYFNPALPVASGLHFRNTTRTLQDQNLTLLPDGPFRLLLGYSRVSSGGPGLTTFNVGGSRVGDEFPLFSDIRRQQNEYRIGFDARMAGIKLSVMRSWEFFRDDTRQSAGAEAGNNSSDAFTLSSLRRDEPYHGRTDTWRVNVLREGRRISFNGRFVYAGGRRDFITDELALGTQRLGAGLNRQIAVSGNGRRPVTTGTATITIFPSEQLTISNHTAVHSTRMDGDARYVQFDNASLALNALEFQYLGITTIANSTDVNYRATKVFGAFAGYQYSWREIRSTEQQTTFGEAAHLSFTQDNTLHAGRAGMRLQPWKPVTVVLDGEIGRADRPIYPTSERNYHAIGGRLQYKTGGLTLSTQVRTNYNVNSVSLFTHSSRNRNYSADASWTARPWLSFDATYSRIHLDSLTGIAYFFNARLTPDVSTYISNIHSGYFSSRVALGSRAEFTVGYSRIQDTGDGRSPGPAAPWILGTAPAPITPGTLGYVTYPLSFGSPLARLSIRLRRNVRWNAGYQHYNYAEELLRQQDYRAHTGYTSLSWMF